MGQITSNIPSQAQQVGAANTESQSPNILFNARSLSTTSHRVEVDQTPIVVRAYGLSGGQTVTVNSMSYDGLSWQTTPLIINGKTVTLSVTNTALVIDMSGNYNFVLSAGLGTVSCVWHASSMSYGSYGLSDYSGSV